LTGVGQGAAKERVGGLLLRLALTAVGEDVLRPGATIPMPLTQRHLAGATGLTPVHVNRVLRQLREEQILELRDGNFVVLDAKKLLALTEPGADWATTAPPRTGSAQESGHNQARPWTVDRSGPGAIGFG
jgi:hypothetical protein